MIWLKGFIILISRRVVILIAIITNSLNEPPYSYFVILAFLNDRNILIHVIRTERNDRDTDSKDIYSYFQI